MMSQDIALGHQLAAAVLRRHTRAVPRKVARSATPRAVVCPPRFHHYHWSSLYSHCCVDSARITDNNPYQKQSSQGPAHLAKSRSLNTHLRKQQHKCCYVSPPFPIRLAIQEQIQQIRLQRHNIPTSYGMVTDWFGSSDLDNELATDSVMMCDLTRKKQITTESWHDPRLIPLYVCMHVNVSVASMYASVCI